LNGGIASLRRGVVLTAVAFGVTLALVIGLRLDQAALAVVVGVACGVGASIPTALLVVMLLRRRARLDTPPQTRDGHPGLPAAPPVVIVAPPGTGQLPAPSPWPDPYAAPSPRPALRDFTVIGDEELKDGYDLRR
jgi:hypothetical protein